MKDNGFSLRLRMVQCALDKQSLSAAAKEFRTSRNTVRKWVTRFHARGLQGLRDESRAPKHRPRRIKPELEAKIRELRTRYRWGPQRLKVQCGLPCSADAIYRVIRQAGLIKHRIPKWKKKRDLREQKKKLAAFEKIQVDVKDLSDIPEYWGTASRESLPRYEYTARDVRTGATFVSFAFANNETNAGAFAAYLTEHLRAYGVELEELRIQSDNGSEFIGSVKKKRGGPTDFERVLQRAGIRHERIPPRCSTWNSDVETVHRTIEDELYSIEPLRTRPELLGKTYTYQLFYNHFRKNRWRDNQSPREILDSVAADRYDPAVLSLPPVLLEELLASPIPGNDVAISPSRAARRH